MELKTGQVVNVIIKRNTKCEGCKAESDFAVSTRGNWTYLCDQCVVSYGWMHYTGSTAHHNREMYLLSANNEPERIN